MIASRLHRWADWLEKPRKFRWPRRTPWRSRMMWRYAVREHRRIHSQSYMDCKLRLMTSRLLRALKRMMDDEAAIQAQAFVTAMGSVIKIRRLERLTAESDTDTPRSGTEA